MYTIVRRLNGVFTCYGKLQDCTESWEENSLAKAVKSLKKFAWNMNGTKIKKRDIDYYEEELVTQPEIIVKKFNKIPK